MAETSMPGNLENPGQSVRRTAAAVVEPRCAMWEWSRQQTPMFLGPLEHGAARPRRQACQCPQLVTNHKPGPVATRSADSTGHGPRFALSILTTLDRTLQLAMCALHGLISVDSCPRLSSNVAPSAIVHGADAPWRRASKWQFGNVSIFLPTVYRMKCAKTICVLKKRVANPLRCMQPQSAPNRRGDVS